MIRLQIQTVFQASLRIDDFFQERLDISWTQQYNCVMIPQFEDGGNLPPGIHRASWSEFRERFGTTIHRKKLLMGLAAALRSLKAAGCTAAYIDGSFVTSAEDPADFDGCWDGTGVDATKLDPVLLRFENGRMAQKIKFGGELFPMHASADRAGNTFLDFFQSDRNGSLKGIVALELQRIVL